MSLINDDLFSRYRTMYYLNNPNNDITKTIDYYRTRSVQNLEDEQYIGIPTLQPDQIEYQIDSYIMGERRFRVRHYQQVCFKLKYLKFKNSKWNISKKYDTDNYIIIGKYKDFNDPNKPPEANELNKGQYIIVNDQLYKSDGKNWYIPENKTFSSEEILSKYYEKNTPMKELVDNNIIYPFALFIEGLFIPWHYMSISISDNGIYLIVKINDIGYEDIRKYDIGNGVVNGRYFYPGSTTKAENDDIMPTDTDIGAYALVDNEYYRFNGFEWVSSKFDPIRNNILHKISTYKYAQIVAIPDILKYNDTDIYNDSNIALGFSDIGTIQFDGGKYNFIRLNEQDVYIQKYNINDTYLDFRTDMKKKICNIFDEIEPESEIIKKSDSIDKYNGITKIKLSENNALIFDSITGRLSMNRNILKKSEIRDEIDGFVLKDDKSFESEVYNNSLEIYQVTNAILENYYEASFDTSLMYINSNNNTEDSVNLSVYIFINPNASNSIDNANIFDRQGLENLLENNINDELKEDILNPFNLNMDKNTSYSINRKNAIRTILNYNANAFDNVILNTSNLEITEYTGKFIKDRIRRVNSIQYFYLPRRHDELSDEYILMLVNGELYKHSHAIIHRAGYCMIPIININDNDIIEFMKFKNVNNSVSDLVVDYELVEEPIDDGQETIQKYKPIEIDYSPDYINNNMNIFSNIPDTTSEEYPYIYPYNGKQYFPIDYNLIENKETNKVQIELKSDTQFYYNKPLVIAHPNRFVHKQYRIPDSSYVQYRIDLTADFLFCTDYNKFIVFYNGRKVDTKNYKIVLPNDKDNPFFEFYLYYALPVKENDRIDVVYVPSLMMDIVCREQVVNPIITANVEENSPYFNEDGELIIKTNVLKEYGLGSEMYIFWINGKKIAASNIRNIDSNNVAIISTEQSIHNLCITKFIPGIAEISEIFRDESYEPLWDSIVSRLNPESIRDLLAIPNTGEFVNNEENILNGSPDIEEVMKHMLIEQYVMNPYVDITAPFVYGYKQDNNIDTTSMDGTDDSGNIIFPAADANKNTFRSPYSAEEAIINEDSSEGGEE